MFVCMHLTLRVALTLCVLMLIIQSEAGGPTHVGVHLVHTALKERRCPFGTFSVLGDILILTNVQMSRCNDKLSCHNAPLAMM